MTSPHSDQCSTSPVLLHLDQMIPLLANGPYSSATLSKLSFLCTGLKAVGPLLDTNNKDKLDLLQNFLTKICRVGPGTPATGTGDDRAEDPGVENK